MATESHVLSLGSACPNFALWSVDGKRYSQDDFSKSKGLVIAFICNHCPYVKAIEDRLLALARAFDTSDLQVVGICSNDASEYPEDAPAELLKRWKQKNYGFPYLVDEAQDVARAFDAACTPDLYLYDQSRKLYYHGRIDDGARDASKVTREELKEAIRSMLAGKPAPQNQKNSVGCSIKWKH